MKWTGVMGRLATRLDQLQRHHWALVIGAILAIQTLLALFVVPVPRMWTPSSYHFGFVDDYDKLGLMLSQGHGYRFTPSTGLTLTREPGFPLILAALFYLFGYGLLAVRALNLLCAGLSALLLARMVKQVTPSKAAPFVAVILFLIHPGVFIAELRGGVEMIFILLLLSFFAVLSRALRVKTLSAYLQTGLLLGVATTVRSTALLFPLFLPIHFFLCERPSPSILAMARRLLVLGAGVVLVLAPWMARNFLLVGSPIATSSVQGIAAHAGLYICQNVSLENSFEPLDLKAAAIRTQMAKDQGYSFFADYYLYFYDPHDEVRFNSWLGKQVADTYVHSPLLFAKCSISNVFNFWFSGTTWSATAGIAAIQLPYLLMATLGGIAYARRRDLRLLSIPLLFCLYTILVYAPIHAQARYSVPLIPLLSLFAAVGLGAAALSEPTRDILRPDDTSGIDTISKAPT